MRHWVPLIRKGQSTQYVILRADDLGSPQHTMPTVREKQTDVLAGERVGFLGRLSGMSRREVAQLVRGQGGTPIDPADGSITLLVVGEEQFATGDRAAVRAQLDEPLRTAAARGSLRIIGETELWQRLGLVDHQDDVRRLYTPAMLAELLGVPVAAVRRWHRRGRIVACREVRRLPYFDFSEVAVARLLAKLFAAGCSLRTIDRKLDELAERLSHIERPLATLPFVVEGRTLLMRQGNELAEPTGQLMLDFDEMHEESTLAEAVLSTAERPGSAEVGASDGETPVCTSAPATPEEMIEVASELADEGQLSAAIEMYRAALVSGGPSAEVNFLLAELLYRSEDLHAARERYYAAVELDEDYVEARANLGCVLVETGEQELAVAAFQGALAYHYDYPDVHYHLARTLDELGRADEAVEHWRTFLTTAPDSPWADDARDRLSHD